MKKNTKYDFFKGEDKLRHVNELGVMTDLWTPEILEKLAHVTTNVFANVTCFLVNRPDLQILTHGEEAYMLYLESVAAQYESALKGTSFVVLDKYNHCFYIIGNRPDKDMLVTTQPFATWASMIKPIGVPMEYVIYLSKLTAERYQDQNFMLSMKNRAKL